MLASSSSSSIILVFLLVVLFSPTFSRDIRKRSWPFRLRDHQDTKKMSGTAKDLDHRGEDTNHVNQVNDLFEICKPNNRRLLIRKADYHPQASKRLCTNGNHTSIQCVCNKRSGNCEARFSLRTLGRIYSAVDSANNTVWADFVKDFHENGNYTIEYECIGEVRRLSPCVQRIRTNVTRIALFPTANPTPKDQQCEMECYITRNAHDRAKLNEPFKWDHHFVLLNEEAENKNSAEYQIVSYQGNIDTTWKRFKPSRLEEEESHAKKKDIQKLRMRFLFQNVSEVLRFWLEFRDPRVDVDCKEITKTTSTTMTSGKTSSRPVTTPPSTKEPNPDDHRKNKGGTVAHLLIIPALLLILLLALVAIVCLATKRRRKRNLNEEASQLLSTPPSFPNPDPDSSHHPQEASYPSPSQGRHVTGSGSDDDNPYDCLNHRGSQERRGRREESDYYSHVVRYTSDGAYDRFQRAAGRRQEVLDNPYDHTFVVTD